MGLAGPIQRLSFRGSSFARQRQGGRAHPELDPPASEVLRGNDSFVGQFSPRAAIALEIVDYDDDDDDDDFDGRPRFLDAPVRRVGEDCRFV